MCRMTRICGDDDGLAVRIGLNIRGVILVGERRMLRVKLESMTLGGTTVVS